ncbi:MAG: PAS domain S-box protein [Pirellulaceae bacterium]
MTHSDPESNSSLLSQLEQLRSNLLAAENRYESILDAASDCIITLDVQFQIQSWNREAELSLGWLRDEAIGQDFFQVVVCKIDREKLQHSFQQIALDAATKFEDALVSTRMIEQDTCVLHKQGTQYNVHMKVTLLAKAGPHAYSVVFRQFAGRTPAMETLLRKEAEIRSLVQFTAEGIYVLDLDGHCTFANNACAELLGYHSPSELIGQPMHDLIHHTDGHGKRIPREQCRIYSSFLEGVGVHLEEEILWKKDGSSFPVEVWSTPMLRDDELVGSVVTFIDISLRHSRQLAQMRAHRALEQQVGTRDQQLAQAEDRLAMALTRANIGLWDWNATTNQVYFSPTYKTQLGFPADTDWRDFDAWKSRIHPDDVDAALERVDEYFARKSKDYRSKFRMQCSDGSYRWFLAQGNADFDGDGQPQRVMGVHVDITDQVHSEQELQRLNNALAVSNDALRESNFELQQFAAVASHDLQAPLRAISGFAQYLHDDYLGQLDATADDYINRIVRNAQRMQRLIDDLLAFSQAESRVTSYDTINLDDIFDDAVGLLQSAIQSSRAKVTREDLPTVNADPVQMTQLFQNLVGNGVKYQDGISPSVHVSVKHDDNDWIFAVQDNGIGIDPAHHERVFEIFRRLHTQAVYTGSGLGLALCRRIVTRHGGRIWVESKLDCGSTFYFTIPRFGKEPPNVEAGES